MRATVEQAKLDKQLAARLEALCAQSAAACDALTAANAAYDAAHLAGPRVAPETAAAQRARLRGVSEHVAGRRAAWLEAAEALGTELGGALAGALGFVEAMLPSFREDIAFVEALDRSLGAARAKAARALQGNGEDAAALEAAVERLAALLSAGDASAHFGGGSGGGGLGTMQAVAAAGPSEAGAERALQAPAQAAGERCGAVLAAADDLRARLLSQAQALECLASTGLAASRADAVISTLRLPSDGVAEGDAQAQADARTQATRPPSSGRVGTSRGAGGPAARGTTPSPVGAKRSAAGKPAGSGGGTGKQPTGGGGRRGSGSGGRDGCAAADGRAPPQPAVQSLFTDVAGAIDAAVAAVEEAGAAYYSKKASGLLDSATSAGCTSTREPTAGLDRSLSSQPQKPSHFPRSGSLPPVDRTRRTPPGPSATRRASPSPSRRCCPPPAPRWPACGRCWASTWPRGGGSCGC